MKLSWLMRSDTRVRRWGVRRDWPLPDKRIIVSGASHQKSNCSHHPLYQMSCLLIYSLGQIFGVACLSLWAVLFVRTFTSFLLFSFPFEPTFIPPFQVRHLVPSISSLAAPLSFSLQKVVTHWAHQPAERSFFPLTDESEVGGCHCTDSFFSAQIY